MSAGTVPATSSVAASVEARESVHIGLIVLASIASGLGDPRFAAFTAQIIRDIVGDPR